MDNEEDNNDDEEAGDDVDFIETRDEEIGKFIIVYLVSKPS